MSYNNPGGKAASVDVNVYIQGLNNKSDKESDAFLYGQMPEIFAKVLPYGITTVKDLCAPRHFIYKLRDELKKGKITGPELLLVGPNFTAPGGHPAITLGGDNPWMREEMAIEVSASEDVSARIRELKAADSEVRSIHTERYDSDRIITQEILHDNS